jgi:glycosyltransferase involved in cell wall biosynthesis
MMKTMMNALLIVQPDFLDVHVGVRRVTLFYWQALEAAGYRVSLGAVRDRKLFLIAPLSLEQVASCSHGAAHDVAPCWTSNDPVFRPQRDHESHAFRVVITDKPAHPEQFQTSIITAPWLCAGLPEGRYTAGIVHDLVPNLMSVAALHFGSPVDCYEFAWQHDVGNAFFIRNCESTLCVSQSTRNDFRRFYRLQGAAAERVRTVIPFAVEPAPAESLEKADESKTAGAEWLSSLRELLLSRRKPASKRTRKKLLLVNVLDQRKNFAGAATALKLLKDTETFDVTIVGAERMPRSIVLCLLEELSEAGISVEWSYKPGDGQLARFYEDSDVLVFPSFYEGLGLPILEAQSHGLPVISSSSSSCGEINMNRELCTDVSKPANIAAAIRLILRNPDAFAKGEALKNRLDMTLASMSRLEPSIWAKESA